MISVPANQPTIQGAISVAVDGDEIVVAPGMYVETLNFLGKAVHVRSSGGPAATTISAGVAAGPVVSFNNGEGVDSILEGFTISGGGAPGPGGPPAGGGIAVHFSGPTIRGNILRDNDVTLGAGGGIYLIASFGAVIVGNMIVDNDAGVGGGVHMQDCSNVIVANNTIAGNSATQAGGFNHLGSIGTEFHNNIVWGNGAAGMQDTTALQAHYSAIEGGWAGTLNLNVDPQFVDAPAGDYHLTALSPCVGAGNAAAPGVPLFDIDGDTRVLCGALDIGADENGACGGVQFVRGDCNTDGTQNLADPIFNLTYQFQNGPSFCLKAQDVNDDGSINIGDAVYQLTTLFGGGPAPEAPFPACGSDPTADALSCDQFAPCP